MLTLENKKNTRTVTSYNDITKNFFEAERLTSQEPHKPVVSNLVGSAVQLQGHGGLCSKIADVHGIEVHEVRTWKFVYFRKIFLFFYFYCTSPGA